jgi:GH15 family glucan-1,4-alpha-glucosidase
MDQSTSSLELGLIGNGTVAALIDQDGRIVWCCMPRFDGDATFCTLLRGEQRPEGTGSFDIELVDQMSADQEYAQSTAILVTRLHDQHGGVVEVTDFAPRFRQFGRVFCPMMIVRRLRRVAGSPRVRYRLRPACEYGAGQPQVTWGSHHIRYVMPALTLRLTTDASITAILEERPVFLDEEATLVLGPDESIAESIGELGRRFCEETQAYWRQWVRYLALPFEWQDAVIRAAITLKLNAFDDTGAIVAAVTTSIPEAAHSQRNWDYRYCWLRDGYFTVNALNRLGATGTMERYLGFIVNVAAGVSDGSLQPCYGISGAAQLEEREIASLAGYRGMGPVRVGNQAYLQVQHDVYGSAILAASHVFFDRRLIRGGDAALFSRLESLGEHAFQAFDQPDAGLWELRGSARVHTFSSVMCWAANDRLARIARHLGLDARAAFWAARAEKMRSVILARAWSGARNSFVSSFEGMSLDASLLLMHELGFLAADDPRFASTVAAIESELKHGDFVYRYVESDDFGKPENAFLVCTFWYLYAIAALGRVEEARKLFERLLACRTRHGLLAEHIDPRTGEQWGNFVQTYSMVGLINAAIRLSIRWDQAF